MPLLRRIVRPLVRRLRPRARRFVLASVGSEEKRELNRLKRLVDSGRVEIGRHTYGVPRVATYIGDASRVMIGSFCSISGDVEIFTGGNHRPDWVSTFPFRSRFGLPGAYEDGHPASRGDVVIGNDVWIARGATILSGVRIGDGAVVGAHAVVTKDVRPYAVVVGNPAREIRRRFGDDTITRLLALRWWDWPEERILAAVPLLSSDRIDELLEAAERGEHG